MKTCTIPGCDKRMICRGMCHMHYRRWRRGKDLLEPQQISSPGVPREWLLSHVGHTGDDCLIWPFAKDTNGYGRLSQEDDSYKGIGAHREMCRLSHGEPPTPKHHAAHLCGNGHLGCVHPKHLSWKTAKENSDDREVHGTVNRGTRNGSAKLTEDQVREIRAIYDSRPPRSKGTAELGAQFGVHPSIISAVGLRRKWAWLQ